MEKDNDALVAPTAGPSRKNFLRTAGAVAAGAVAAASLPEVARAARVEVGRDLAPVTVNFFRGAPTSGPDYEGNLITNFTKANPDIAVKQLFGPLSTTSMYDILISQLAAGASAIDLIQGDVIWPPSLAAAGWLLPLDKYVSASLRADTLPGPLLGNTVGGKLYGFPFFTDAGVLYYRTDLLSKYKLAPPKTYMDLVNAAITVTKNEKSVPYGMLWQGAQYEGLFCDLCEIIWSNGGNILENFGGPKVVINSPQNLVAMQWFVDTVQKYKIAPLAVTTYMEEDTRQAFIHGESVFMRNWPYVWASGNDPKQSSIVGKFQLGATVVGPTGKAGASCLGGWSMMINSKSKNPDAAAKLALYLTSYNSQKYMSINAGQSPTLTSVYSDPAVLAKNPWYKHFFPAIKNALPRPVNKNEAKISDRVTRQINAALKGDISVSAALTNAQRDVEAVMSGGNQP